MTGFVGAGVGNGDAAIVVATAPSRLVDPQALTGSYTTAWDSTFLFGRIIRTDAALFGQSNLLLYFYDAWSDDAQDIPALARDRLLIPPVVTNRLGWSRGFFNHVENRPLTRGDVLSVHCFVSNVYRDGPRYFDEFRNQLPGHVPPVGEAGLHSYRTIDDEISRALGIPLAPEE